MKTGSRYEKRINWQKIGQGFDCHCDIGIFYAEILAWIGADIILVPSYYYVISKIDR